MSSFTSSLAVMPMPEELPRMTPPGLRTPSWATLREFVYAIGSEDSPDRVTVPCNFIFDGASTPLFMPIPLFFLPLFGDNWVWGLLIMLPAMFPRLLFPRSHPAYMQAAALHDWLYIDIENGRSRAEADAIFYEALGVLGMRKFYRTLFWASVRLGGWAYWHRARKGPFGDVMRRILGDPEEQTKALPPREDPYSKSGDYL